MPNDTLTDRVIRFLNDYYRDEIGTLAQRYPKEQTSLDVSYGDLFQWDRDVAADWIDKPEQTQAIFEEALRLFDLPADIDLSGASVNLVDLDSDRVFYPNELTTDHTGYVGVYGDLGQVTDKDEIPLEAAFECQRCGTMTYIPQTANGMQEPHECQGCERQGPFRVDDQQTDWEDYCKVRLETPPDESGSPNAEFVDGYCIGEPVHEGGEYGLIGRAGETAILYGTVERERKSKDEMLFERVLKVEAVEFPEEDEEVDIEANRDEFETLAAQENAVDLIAESVAPALYATDAWETAMEWAVAYLFGAPRIELDDGTVYRGDIHGGIFSDYGMGKSMFSHGIENLSPKCIRKSATALSSDVGLTAAAVDDGIGDGWTLKPGILVRGNGGHVILDEIDKGPDDMESINDAIEGQQRVDVEKAGLSAEYNSRVGLLAMGNPKEGRFDPTQPVAPQLGVDSSFLSRFDGIITMEDTADVEIDEQIARQMGHGYAEANQLQYGDLDKDDFEALDAPVDADVARAWIKEARENYNPIFRKELVDEIQEWYAQEVRQLNKTYAEDGAGEDMPVPATARVVMWVIRFSMAFARCRLREEVTTQDVDRAMKLAKRLVSQNWDGEKFDSNMVEGMNVDTQADRIQSLKDLIGDIEGETPADVDTVKTRAQEELGIDERDVEGEIDKLKQKGELYEPQNGEVRTT